MKSTLAAATAACLLALHSTTFTTTMAFAPTAVTHPAARYSYSNPSSSRTASLQQATMAAAELTDLSEDDLMERIGVEKNKLAMGIDADEVLQFIGTREDLVNKFQNDIPKFSRTDAEREVDKFLMDGEMLDIYIKYSQRKAEDPNWEPQYAEEDNSPFAVFQRIVSTYAIWIIGGLLVKDLVTDYMSKQNGGGGEEVLVASSQIMDVVHHISSTLSV